MSAQFSPPSANTLSVSGLNRLVRDCLESAFPLTWVSGEISNLTYAASGHVYFSLKDDGAQVRCVMWRNRAQLLGWRLENGQKIDARSLVSFYEPRGEFQLNVESIRRTGQGDLFERFLKLKAKLEGEGLFAPEIKRPLPPFPRRIALVTSIQAAALRDVLATLQRRAPHIAITLYPTPVQGDGAAARIAEALCAADRGDNDLIILCRGGGSIEDLWSFNEEAVAYAIRQSSTPVVSGVGHETDFTIADFAADLRAPTPTAAAELASPDRNALANRLSELHRRLSWRSSQQLAARTQHLDHLTSRLTHPAERLRQQREALELLGNRLHRAVRQEIQSRHYRRELLAQRLQTVRPKLSEAGRSLAMLAQTLSRAMQRELSARHTRLSTATTSLNQLNPHAVLARGYTLALGPDGRAVRDASRLNTGDALQLSFAHGSAEVRVDRIVTPDSGQ